jgi:hypothetical protein
MTGYEDSHLLLIILTSGSGSLICLMRKYQSNCWRLTWQGLIYDGKDNGGCQFFAV